MAKAPRKRKRTESRPASSELAAAMGRAIQVVRTDRGWSRKEFAERTGLSYSFLSEIENGVKQPSSRNFAVIAEALDVAPGALLYDAERRMTEDSSGAVDGRLSVLESETTPAGDEAVLSARRAPSVDELEEAAHYLARESSASNTTRAAPPGESSPRIERSRRVLDWLAGPLAPRSSSDDPMPTAASLRRRRARPRANRMAPFHPEVSPAETGSADAEFETVEPSGSAESLEEFAGALLPLLGELSPEDRELVLDLARRLAQRESE